MDYTKLLIGVITQSYILKLKGMKRKIVHFLVMNTRKTVFKYHSDIVALTAQRCLPKAFKVKRLIMFVYFLL